MTSTARWHRATPLAFALLFPAGAAMTAPDPATVPSTAVPGTHDCANFFPEAARRDNESGDVQVSYDVGADGAISNVTVVKSSGHPLLDRAAVVCVSTAWRNTPAESGGVAVASPGHQAIIRFELTAAPPAPVPPPEAAPAPVSAPEEQTDFLPLLGLAGVVLLIVAGGALLLYRRRRRDGEP